MQGKKYLLIVLMCGFTWSVFAQKQKLPNLPQYDNKTYHFGFLLGMNSTNFLIRYTPEIKKYDTIMAVVSKGQGGFNLGIVSDARLGEYFNVRFIPTLSFCERNLIYTIRNSQGTYYDIKKSVESTFVDFPVYIKYKSERLNNGRAYLLAGGKYSLDMAARKNQDNIGDIAILKLKRNSFSYHLGFGIDVYTTYFKFSPEIRYCVGINNVLIKDGGPFSSSVEKLFSKIWELSFTFE